MNKSIKYLGFSFLGAMLFLSLGALRPFISSESGLGNNTILSNATMVSSFRSLYGSLTNICADDTGLQHVRIIPQTANTGEFDIGDPAQATGRYLMFSKPAGTFLLGHDGTDAFRVNVANGYVTIPGGSLFGDGTGGIFELNANAQFEVDPLGQLFLNGDDTVASHRSEIFLHGTNAHIRLDLGAPIEDWTAITHLTMAPGSASLDGGKFIGNGAGLTNLNGDSLARNTLFTNENVTHYLLTNEVLGTYIAWIPGVGLVKSNTITHAATLIVGTNGGAHYGGWTPAGVGNVVVDGQFTGNGVGVTGLVHSSTVSAGSGVTVATSQNADGSTNYQVTATGTGSGITTQNGKGTNTAFVGPWVDITVFGAVGDGSTDNTLSLSNANFIATSSNWWVQIPAGNFVSSNLHLTCPGIRGYGTNSQLTFRSDCVGTFLDSSNNSVSFLNFDINGGSAKLFNASTNTAGTRIGCIYNQQSNSRFSRMSVHGFDYCGLEAVGTASAENPTQNGFVELSLFYNNFFALTNFPGTTEYSEWRNNLFYSNFCAVAHMSANMIISGNRALDCYNGEFWGTASDYRGHCSSIDNTWNHIGSGVAVVVNSNATGGLFNNNRLLGGGCGINIFNSKVMQFTHNYFEGTHLTVDTGGNHLSTNIVFAWNTWSGTGGLVDNSARVVHYGNTDINGTLLDGSGNPWFALGGFGLTTPTDFLMRGTISSTNGFWGTNSSSVFGIGSQNTNATDGYLYLSTVTNAPLAVPTARAGYCPMLVDTNAVKLWIYVNGGWKFTQLN